VKTALVLGTERSGSTWVANVFDAHPDVELVMEPLAEHAALVPGFPEREIPDDGFDDALVAAFRTGIEAAPRHKYALLYRRGAPPALERFDAALLAAIRRASRRFGRPAPVWARRHASLNLHASEVPARLRPHKRRKPALRVVKELRLNFKLGLVVRALPDARAVVTLRNPAAQIASIRRLFAAGRLVELERSLDRQLAIASSHPSLARAWAVAGSDRRPDDAVGALVCWWLVNNHGLLEGLARLGTPYRIVSHEELCESPLSVADALLSFVGLAPDATVRAFARWSSTGRGDATSPLDVRRDSPTFHHRALEAAGPELRERVAADLRRALDRGLAPDLASYLAKTCLPALEGAKASGDVR
jgi:hypothetical protein